MDRPLKTSGPSLLNAIIIGVKKCGTRALLEFLKLNPKIKAPGPEVHFFDKNYDLGYDWYRQQMPFTSPGQITLEKSPAYFVGKLVPERVHKMNPRIKLIVVVRNPITRAISDFTQAVTRKRRHIGSTRFEDLATCPTNGTRRASCSKGVSHNWNALKIGIYHRFLRKWLEYFPRKQFLFIDGERLITDPATEIRKAEKFLGLTPTIKSTNFVKDPVKGFPCVKRFDATIHCLGKSKGRTHPKVMPDVIHRLEEFYQPENERFFELIGQRFKWF
uniref:Sulfotransferase domain-containing protein n=1 Tax=Acrobeloides nanus TaxID=290746 RepID=A0A914EKF3_9BILA